MPSNRELLNVVRSAGPPAQVALRELMTRAEAGQVSSGEMSELWQLVDLPDLHDVFTADFGAQFASLVEGHEVARPVVELAPDMASVIDPRQLPARFNTEFPLAMLALLTPHGLPEQTKAMRLLEFFSYYAERYVMLKPGFIASPGAPDKDGWAGPRDEPDAQQHDGASKQGTKQQDAQRRKAEHQSSQHQKGHANWTQRQEAQAPLPQTGRQLSEAEATKQRFGEELRRAGYEAIEVPGSELSGVDLALGLLEAGGPLDLRAQLEEIRKLGPALLVEPERLVQPPKSASMSEAGVRKQELASAPPRAPPEGRLGGNMLWNLLHRNREGTDAQVNPEENANQAMGWGIAIVFVMVFLALIVVLLVAT
jgi:hypothetical protein